MGSFRLRIVHALVSRPGSRSLAVLLLLVPFLLGACQGRGTPVPGPITNELYAVVALAPDNVWAVGEMSTSQYPGTKVLIEHWDGTHWQTNMPDHAGELDAISASSANDMWAVGQSQQGVHGLVLHWDGQQWQQVVVPPAEAYPTLLTAFTAVTALAPNNVWVAGDTQDGPLIVHWDGTQWVSVAQPVAGMSYYPTALVAFAANDLWMAGERRDGADNFPLPEHWDGHQWTMMPTPGYAQDPELAGNSDLGRLATVPSGHVWAVGSFTPWASPYEPTPLIEQWDGTAWQIVSAGAPAQTSAAPHIGALTAVTAVNVQPAWAVGTSSTQESGPTAVLVLRWNGQDWQTVKTPKLPHDGLLTALASLSANDVWAVGETIGVHADESQTLIGHWNGVTWQRIPSPNPGTPARPIGQG